MQPAEHHESPPRPLSVPAVSVRDLLAACAAAEAVSTPPREPTPAGAAGAHPEAA